MSLLLPADPRTGAPGKPVPVKLDPLPFEAGVGWEIAVGEGRVWVGREQTGEVVMYDPASGEQKSVATGTLEDLATGRGYGWAVAGPPEDDDPYTSDYGSGGSLDRFDPRTGDTESTELDDDPNAVAFGDESVWILYDERVERRDTEGEVQAAVGLSDLDLDGGVGDIAVTGDTAWVTNFSEKRAVRIDAESSKLGGTVEMPTDEPRGLAATDDAAWVTVNYDAIIRLGR